MTFSRILLTAILFFVAVPAMAQEGAAKDENRGENWSVRCNEAVGEEPVSCEMYQSLIIKDTGQRYAEFAIGFPRDKETARGVIILPLGILLQPGARLKIDDNKPFQFNVRFCRNDGCYAVVSLNKDIIESMKSGENAIVAFATLEGKPAALSFTLNGFTKALKEINP